MREVAVAVVAVFAGLYLWNRALVRRAEQALPQAGQRFVIEGLRLHYVEAGAGPPIVLLHGANGTLQDLTSTIFDEAGPPPPSHRH